MYVYAYYSMLCKHFISKVMKLNFISKTKIFFFNFEIFFKFLVILKDLCLIFETFCEIFEEKKTFFYYFIMSNIGNIFSSVSHIYKCFFFFTVKNETKTFDVFFYFKVHYDKESLPIVENL